MKPACVWFNKHLSNTWELIDLLRGARQAGEFRVVCSHPRAGYSKKLNCDHFETEPIGVSDDDYVAFCLEFARRNGVSHFFPCRKIVPILRALEQFERVNVRVVAPADAITFPILQSKARTYAAVAQIDVPIPDFAIVNDLAGFDAAWQRLRAQHRVICYKPDVGVFGLGFRIVDEIAPTDGWRIHLQDARERLARDQRRRDLMVMQYLPGPERSVDCLARDGELVRCIIRRKMDGGQVIEEHRQIEAMVRRLTACFRLNHLFNVQFRDADGEPYLLEINPRMSGGLPFACQSGVALPLWAIRLALGTVRPADVPLPRFGVWVPQPEMPRSL